MGAILGVGSDDLGIWTSLVESSISISSAPRLDGGATMQDDRRRGSIELIRQDVLINCSSGPQHPSRMTNTPLVDGSQPFR